MFNENYTHNKINIFILYHQILIKHKLKTYNS